MYRFWTGLAATAVLALTAGAQAHAAPALGDVVETPNIEDGETSVEITGGSAVGRTDDDRNSAIVELEHGFNSRISGSLVAEFSQAPHESPRVSSLGVEAIVNTGTIPVLDIDTGLYIEYAQGLHGDSGVGEFRALLAKRTDRYEARLNLVAEHPFSSRDDATAYSYLTSADWVLSRNARAGVEALGDLGLGNSWGGRREHYVGPEIKYVINGLPLVGIKLQAAYLVAVGDAPGQSRGQARFGIELEKRF
jgi:hypothetical protein